MRTVRGSTKAWANRWRRDEQIKKRKEKQAAYSKTHRCHGEGCRNAAKKGKKFCGLCMRKAAQIKKPAPKPVVYAKPEIPSGPCERCEQETPCSDLVQRLGVWMCSECRRKDELVLAKMMRMAEAKQECEPF